jgi:hypothetical protein
MSNRRRSERYRIELPVWLKDGHGGEHTVTADVSAHGIAVITDRARTMRQYVELELTLPNSRIGVTAMVARTIEGLEAKDGKRGRGIGLDFFLFDSRAKVEWQRFMMIARSELEQNMPAAVESSPGFDDREPTQDEPEEGTPTFIIKPRDLGRLWAFFRGELSKGTVRIETPIAREIGEPVELLVVHPSSEAEWTLEGRVGRTIEHGRGGRPVLEIELIGLDAAARTEFRNFVATGLGAVVEEVPLVSELPKKAEPEPIEERARSVVINLEVGGEEALLQPSAKQGGDLSLLADEKPLFEEWLKPTQGGAPGNDPIRLPTSALSPMQPLPVETETEAVPQRSDLDIPDDEEEEEEDHIEELATAEPDTEDEPENIATEYRDFDVSAEVRPEPPPPPPSTQSLSGRLFASFFFEAQQSTRPSPALQTIIPVSTTVREAKPIATKPLTARIEIKPPPLPPQSTGPLTPPPLPPLPPSAAAIAQPRTTPPPPPPAPSRPKEENSITVEPVHLGDRSPPLDVPRRNGAHPSPVKRTPAAPNQRVAETPGVLVHRQVSTAGTDPGLDRDIALARARVVRSPNSVTACFRLSTLLMKRGERDHYDEVIGTLQRVMELEPNHPGAHHAAAEALAQRGEFEAAAEHLQRARRLGYRIDPDLERTIQMNRET